GEGSGADLPHAPDLYHGNSTTDQKSHGVRSSKLHEGPSNIPSGRRSIFRGNGGIGWTAGIRSGSPL
ncbi:uncharacterized protein METZ01_LOCUS295522, partial [marine metagenome]